MTGNVCDKLKKVEKCGNEASISTWDVRKVGFDQTRYNMSKEEKQRLRVSNIYDHNASIRLDKECEVEQTSKIYKERNKECEE